MSIVLKHEIEASEHAASDIEREIEGQKISLCYEVQSLLKGLVVNAKNLRDFVELEQASLKRGQPYFDANLIKEIDGLYRRLEMTFGRAHQIIKKIQTFAAGYVIEGQHPFHLAWAELRGVVCFSLESIMTASEQADRGEGRKLTEWMHELRH